MTLKMPVRWFGPAGNYNGQQYGEEGHRYATLELKLERTAFMVVDSDCGSGNPHVEEGIAPALAAARKAGMHVFYIHNDFSLVDEAGQHQARAARNALGHSRGRGAAGPGPDPRKARLLTFDPAAGARAGFSQAGMVGVPRDPHRLPPALQGHQDVDRRGVQPAGLPLPDHRRSGRAQLPGDHAAGLHPLRGVLRHGGRPPRGGRMAAQDRVPQLRARHRLHQYLRRVRRRLRGTGNEADGGSRSPP